MNSKSLFAILSFAALAGVACNDASTSPADAGDARAPLDTITGGQDRAPLPDVGPDVPAKVTLTIRLRGSGSGSVTSTPAGIDCGKTCAVTLTSGASVSLKATPVKGSTLLGFGGDKACEGGTLKLTQDTTCDVLFAVSEGASCVSFGGYGVIKVDLVKKGVDVATTVRDLPDGRLLVGGYASNGKDNDFVLMRLNFDGSIDPAFGKAGVITTDLGGDDAASRMLLLPSGKAILAGNSGNKLALARYQPDGKLDPTFATSGTFTHGFGGGQRFALSLFGATAAGKLMVVGRLLPPKKTPYGKIAIFRFNADGSLDGTFGTKGVLLWTVAGVVSGFGVTVSSGRVLPSGALLLVGSAGDGSGPRIFKTLPDGKPDPAFGTAGVVKGSSGTNYASIAFHKKKNLIVSGYTQFCYGGTARPFLAAFLADGKPDKSFGTGGTIVGNKTQVDNYTTLVERPGGKYLMLGNRCRPTDGFHLFRIDAAGALDATFGVKGSRFSTLGGGGTAYDMIVTDDHRIIVVGGAAKQVGKPIDDMALVCYGAR